MLVGHSLVLYERQVHWTAHGMLTLPGGYDQNVGNFQVVFFLAKIKHLVEDKGGDRQEVININWKMFSRRWLGLDINFYISFRFIYLLFIQE